MLNLICYEKWKREGCRSDLQVSLTMSVIISSDSDQHNAGVVLQFPVSAFTERDSRQR